MTKKYYWLKLKSDFFKSKEIKLLRKVAGGDTFTIIYLEMLLDSLQTDGVLYFDGVCSDIAEEIALSLDEEIENVRLTLNYLQNKNLIEIGVNDDLKLNRIDEMIGSETDKAEFMRRKRANNPNPVTMLPESVTMLPDVTKCYTEIEIEIEKEKDIEIEKKTKKEQRHKYGEFQRVLLTDTQRANLIKDFGESGLNAMIKKMDEWIELKGKSPYSNFNLALRNWFDKDNNKGAGNGQNKRYSFTDEII